MTITWEQANQRLERAARLLNDADPRPAQGRFMWASTWEQPISL